MKILLSAIACNPYQGSESYFGWAAAKCLARDHELYVITTNRNRADLERAKMEGLIPPNVRLAYAGAFKDWHPNRLLAQVQSWKEYVHFAKDSLAVATDLHRKEKFDVVQHITFSTWRVASPMWRLGIPFVFGPIGGNESFPWRIFPVLSLSAAAFEMARKVSNVVSRYFQSVRESLQKADHVFVSTLETGELVASIRGSDKGVSALSPGFYSEAKATEFSRFVSSKSRDGLLRIYAAGNLAGHKCIAIALQALSLVKKRGVDFCYYLGASGPEIPHLKKLAAKLDLTQQIVFGAAMSREDYQQELGRTHIYLLPSMRESVGLTMMEAMLAGCVPIVADCGGPKLIVTEDCGYKVLVSTINGMAEKIADIILMIERDRRILSERGPLASKRISTTFAEENYLNTVNTIYRSLTGG
jgi:glycosyltransferase involved in cell wall biosynthesis